jgi:hypothetical protein
MLICPACCRSGPTHSTLDLKQKFHIPVRLVRPKRMWITIARFARIAEIGLAGTIASWFARGVGIT